MRALCVVSLPLVLFLLLATAGLAQTPASDAGPLYSVGSDNTLRFELSFPEPKTAGGSQVPGTPRGFDPATIPGISLPGFSTELAAVAISVTVESVDVVEVDGATVGLSPIEDVPLPESGTRRASQPATTLRGVYPAEWASIGRGGSVGGVDISSLTVHPYRYDPARRSVLWARRLVVRVALASGSDTRNVTNIAGLIASGARARKAPRMLGAATEPYRSTSIVAPDGFEYKVYTDSNGIYRLSALDLVASGIPVEQIDARTFKLYRDGVEVPIYIHDRGNDRLERDSRVEEYIEFFGERPRARAVEPGSDLYYDPFTRYTTWFLTWDGSPGKRLVEEGAETGIRAQNDSEDLTAETASFSSSVHLEENTTAAISFNANLNTPSDRFDRTMWGHIPANTQVMFQGIVPTPNLLSDLPLRMTVALRGSSGKGESRGEVLKKTHTAEIFLENRRALVVRFKGDTLAFASSDSNSVAAMPGSWLGAGSVSTVSVINRFDSPTNTGSSISLNWIELTYQRLYRAFRDRLEFAVPDGLGMRYFRFRLRGFSSPDIQVYRNGISRIANVFIVEQPGADENTPSTYDAVFQVYAASSSEKFTAVTAQAVRRPIITRDSTARLLAGPLDNDYLVIVDDLAANLSMLGDVGHPLREFVERKRSQGYRPRIVRAVDIYDEFSGGRVSPEAIRDFFRHAHATWSTRPRYAMIFGNGTPMTAEDLTNYRSELTDSLVLFLSERSYVPTIYFQTIDFGATPSDYLLGCIDGQTTYAQNVYEGTGDAAAADFFPEVIVGRVNVVSPQEVDNYVDKMIDQQNAGDTGPWRMTSEFIGGGDVTFFEQINGLVNRYYRSSSEPHRIFVSPQIPIEPYGDVRRILGVMKDPGAALITYMGHGGGGQWEDAAILNSGNIYEMGNHDRLGTVLSYTCFTGAYSARYGLLSAMMTQPETGAISAFGTAGLGWLQNNGLLAEAVSSVLYNPRYRGLSFGEIIALGKARYIGINGRTYPDQVPSVAAMYSIFGDPSLEVPLIRDTVTLVPESASVSPGGTMRARVVFPFDPESITLMSFDSTEIAFARSTPSGAAANQVFTLEGALPADYSGSHAGLRVYAKGRNGERVTGSVRFSTSVGSIVEVVPAARLVAGSDASFELRVAGPGAPDSVKVSLDYGGIYAFSGRRLALTKIAEGLYRTDTVGAGWIEPGARLTVAVGVRSSIDGLTTFTFVAEGGPDPAAFRLVAADTSRVRYGPRAVFPESGIPNESIRFRRTASGARLSGTIYNWGESEARDVAWSISRDSSGRRLRLGSGVVTIAAHDSVTVEVATGAELPIEQKIILIVEPRPGDHWSDAHFGNNVSYATLSLAAAEFRNGTGFVVPSGTGSLDFPPAGRARLLSTGATGEGILTATILRIRPESAQPWSFVGVGDSSLSAPAIQLTADPAGASEATISLTLRSDTTAVGARIVRYNRSTRLWLAHETTAGGGDREFSATVPADGIYALAISEDRQGPEVRFSVEGQFYADSAIVPPDARFSVVVQDPSGIDTDPERLVLRLDGDELAVGSDYVILDSTITPTTMNLRLQKTLPLGRHTLEIETTDRLGNRTTERTSFEVERELRLVVYGNYPNPFDVETFLAYEIRGANSVDEVELVIFTTAGRPVRTFRYPTGTPAESAGLLKGGTGQPASLGYHEAWWDGRDDQGRDVANGAYFYRLRVRLADEELEELGTIVRVR